MSNAIPLTVALTTFNRLSWLREAVAAILAQTFQDFEFLILDNHSTDGTAEYCLGLRDPRVRYIRQPPGQNAIFNSVTAQVAARGTRLILTHDDDIMEPELLARQMHWMDADPNLKLVWTRTAHIDEAGRFLNPPQTVPDLYFPPLEYLRHFLSDHLWPMPSGMMFERETVLHYIRAVIHRIHCGGKEIQTRKERKEAGAGDMSMPAIANLHHAIAVIGEPLLRERRHAQQETYAIDINGPMILLYEALYRLSRRRKDHAVNLPKCDFEANRLRYVAQSAFTLETEPTLSPPRLKSLRDRWLRLHEAPDLSATARFALLPLTLALLLHKGGVTPRVECVLAAQYHDLPASSAPTPAARALKYWLEGFMTGGQNTQNTGLLAAFAGQRVMLFGSAFIAALLVLEARRAGAHILGCLDSNSRRQQDGMMLGVPIHPPAWLATQADCVDVLILTPEKAHEPMLRDIAHRFAPRLKVVSWKELADSAFGNSGI
ncbi:MAG: glycosyltransferase family 2 protein [Zoogloeaceae bacterium]|jgi:glycosyltransferase involved in cell wall biosynthesis|nr:glycosyltransferase family 2 protein [Zoogloeaceae bacterium]